MMRHRSKKGRGRHQSVLRSVDIIEAHRDSRILPRCLHIHHRLRIPGVRTACRRRRLASPASTKKTIDGIFDFARFGRCYLLQS